MFVLVLVLKYSKGGLFSYAYFEKSGKVLLRHLVNSKMKGTVTQHTNEYMHKYIS